MILAVPQLRDRTCRYPPHGRRRQAPGAVGAGTARPRARATVVAREVARGPASRDAGGLRGLRRDARPRAQSARAGEPASLDLSRRIAFVCSCETRDSVTP